MIDAIPEVLNNSLIQEIKKMEVALYNRMSELSNRYGQNHPQMIAIQSELDELQKRKLKESEGVINSLRNNYQLALARERSLKGAFEKQKAESLDLNKKAVQFGVLKRQAESSRQMYELLIRRFKETSLTEEMKTGNIRIIDKAEIPKVPVKPNKKRNMLLALAVGLSMGIGLAFLIEYLDNTVKLPEEVKDHLGVTFLGPIPTFDTREKTKDLSADLIAFHSPKSTTSESFRGVRTGILYASPDAAPKVILITSAEPAEGKTLCAANLAVVMAQSGSKVLLLDCDMRRPRIHTLFEEKREKGLSNILIGEASFGDTVFRSEVENLDVLFCGPIPPNPSELLGSKRMKVFIEELRKRYDRILIDSPPITAVTDSVVLSQLADGVVIIIRTGHTARQVLKTAVSRLQAVNAQILGAVLNSVSTRKDSYYYYQYYYYYYGDDDKKGKKERRKKRTSDSPN
jgi:capsular exopolysaccharide synthesis family protein